MDYLLNSSMEMLDEYYQPKDTISDTAKQKCSRTVSWEPF